MATSPGKHSSPLGWRIWQLAWPLMLANCAAPLLGFADTAVIGNTGSTEALGAIALGALIFNFLYWGCGFLRMGTTGFVAQARARGDQPEVTATLLRALIMGFLIGVAFVITQTLVANLALSLLDASAAVEAQTRAYLVCRIWGAPASLASFAILGAWIGLGRSDLVLKFQLFLNGVNIALDLWLAGVMDWGVVGIGVGTAIAEWLSFLLALVLLARNLVDRNGKRPELPWALMLDRQGLRQSLAANGDIILRTLFMLFGFAWFTNQAAGFGDEVLAANHILLQFITFSALILDGFAHAAEPLVGQAIGEKRRRYFDAVLRTSLAWSASSALCLAVGIFVIGPQAIQWFTDISSVRALAQGYLFYAAMYVGLSFAAFQLDGIFIGATQTPEMRNASGMALAVFIVAWYLLSVRFGYHGLWWAMLIYVAARACTLGVYLPRLRARMLD